MATFIEFKDTYNPLTTQGENTKFININQIVYIEPLTKWTHTNNRVEGVHTRICLSTGELLDVPEDFKVISEKIAKNTPK